LRICRPSDCRTTELAARLPSTLKTWANIQHYSPIYPTRITVAEAFFAIVRREWNGAPQRLAEQRASLRSIQRETSISKNSISPEYFLIVIG